MERAIRAHRDVPGHRGSVAAPKTSARPSGQRTVQQRAGAAPADGVEQPCKAKPKAKPPWVDPASNRECDIAIVNFGDLEADAKRLLSPRRYSFIEPIGDGVTYRDNLSAFEAHPILPRRLQGIKDVDPRTQLLGHALPFPIITCPMGSHGRFHVEAENATARGTGKAGTLYVSSGAANKTMEDIAAATGGPKWFQIYMNRDPEINRWLCKRARDAGFTAIVFTVDGLGASESDNYIRNGRYTPPDLTIGNHDPKRGGRGDFRDIKRDIDFEDIRFLKEASGLPVVVKGLTHPDDVDKAIGAGAAAVWISNHGGRQLDGVFDSLTLLEAAAKKANHRVPVIFDSGVRRGIDVFKAIALGADVVAIGRPVLWGLINGGSLGVKNVYDHIVREFKEAMQRSGYAKLKDITRASVG